MSVKQTLNELPPPLARGLLSCQVNMFKKAQDTALRQQRKKAMKFTTTLISEKISLKLRWWHWKMEIIMEKLKILTI